METQHFDVLIVGAGLSGVGAACRLQDKCPEKSFAILEARHAAAGTWDLFRFPGVRSDSDMFTLAYDFKPWNGDRAIADGDSIRRYILETAREHGIADAIRFGHRVTRASWSSSESRWSVEVELADKGRRTRLTCGFLYVCSGYFRYDQGFSPAFAGLERFEGDVLHPQHWPEGLSYDRKQVVVIGSGATAVTIVPAMADRAAHVTMLQRSPSYIVSIPARDPLAELLRGRLPARAAYAATRWKNILLQILSYQLSRRRPELIKAMIRRGLAHSLPPDYDIATDLTPRYPPWDQRLCLAPDGDLFAAIRSGKASIVTDEIDTFTARGVRLASGPELEADLIVTATGLNLQVLGGITLEVDGEEQDLARSVVYKGAMLSGIPNTAVTLGYANASWTLKADLVSEYVCRLLRFMDTHRYRQCVPSEPDPTVPREPLLNLKSGYVLRSIDLLPKQVGVRPWRLHQNYACDIRLLKHATLDDGALRFS